MSDSVALDADDVALPFSLQSDDDAAVASRKLDRVREEIPADLLEPERVRSNRNQLRGSGAWMIETERPSAIIRTVSIER